MPQSFKVANPSSEKLDVYVFEPEQPLATILFVHGWSIGKYEGRNLFGDWAQSLKADYRCVLFDFSGVGESEGDAAENCFSKDAQDLQTMIDWIQHLYMEPLYLIAHSRGCQTTAWLNPDVVAKIVFSGIPNWKSDYVVDRIQERIAQKMGAKPSVQEVTNYPRSNGTVTRIGPRFWQEYDDLDMLALTSQLARKTSLLIMHPASDDVIGHEYIDEYREISPARFEITPGDHSYSQHDDRHKALKLITQFFHE